MNLHSSSFCVLRIRSINILSVRSTSENHLPPRLSAPATKRLINAAIPAFFLFPCCPSLIILHFRYLVFFMAQLQAPLFVPHLGGAFQRQGYLSRRSVPVPGLSFPEERSSARVILPGGAFQWVRSFGTLLWYAPLVCSFVPSSVGVESPTESHCVFFFIKLDVQFQLSELTINMVFPSLRLP